MKEYRSSLFVIAKNIVYGGGGGFVAALVASWFLSSGVAIVLGGLAGLAIIYFAVYKDNINVTLDEERMVVRRFGTVLHEFDLEDCNFHARIVTTSGVVGDSDCALTVTDGDGNETHLDCSMLGKGGFYELLDDLGLTDPAPVALRTTVKDA